MFYQVTRRHVSEDSILDTLKISRTDLFGFGAFENENFHIFGLWMNEKYENLGMLSKKIKLQSILSYEFKFLSEMDESGQLELKLSNLLAPELFFLILAHPVYKMWIIQEPNTLELWNKLHFEEEKSEEYIPCLKYSVPIFVE